MSLPIQTLTHNLSFSASMAPPRNLPIRLSHSITTQKVSPIIRMGGGPRTFPGGVSKWQWKRMQAKKAKQLLKARLCRERQIYEMRKRAELRAAVSDLERPWEVVKKTPPRFSVSADEQLKVLADRFQRPWGFDMWTEKDGPALFRNPDELPSARFFPKGVVHSVKPYRRVSESQELEFGGELGLASEGEGLSDSESLNSKNSGGLWGKGNRRKLGASDSNRPAWSDSEENCEHRNDKRSYDRRFGRRLALSDENGGSLNRNNSHGLRGEGNTRNFGSFDSNGLSMSGSERRSRNDKRSYDRRFDRNNSHGLRGEGNKKNFGSFDSNGLSLSGSERRSWNDKRSDDRRYGRRLVLSDGNGGSLNRNNSHGLRGKGNMRNFGSFDSNGLSLSGSERRSRNDKRSYDRRFGRRLALSDENGGSLNRNNSHGWRGEENKRNFGSFDSNGLSLSGSERRSRNNSRPYGRKLRGQSGPFSEGKIENGELLDSESSHSKNSFEQKSRGFRRKGNGRSFGSSNLQNGLRLSDLEQFSFDRTQTGMKSSSFQGSESQCIRGNGLRTLSDSESEVYDMNLQQDGSYGFQS